MSLANDSDLGDTFDGLEAIEEILGTEPTESPPRILLVDDEPYVLRAIKRVLARMGVEIKTAESGLAALDVLSEESFDVIISDQSMPGMSGIDLLDRVRVAYPNIVRVMLTGNNDLATAVQAINKGDVLPVLA